MLAVVALVFAVLPVLAVSAGSQTETNLCSDSGSGSFRDVEVSTGGTIDYCSPIEHENLYYRRGDGIAA